MHFGILESSWTVFRPPLFWKLLFKDNVRFHHQSSVEKRGPYNTICSQNKMVMSHWWGSTIEMRSPLRESLWLVCSKYRIHLAIGFRSSLLIGSSWRRLLYLDSANEDSTVFQSCYITKIAPWFAQLGILSDFSFKVSTRSDIVQRHGTKKREKLHYEFSIRENPQQNIELIRTTSLTYLITGVLWWNKMTVAGEAVAKFSRKWWPWTVVLILVIRVYFWMLPCYSLQIKKFKFRKFD